VASLYERALLDAARRGQWHAQEELLHRYEPLVRATVRRLRIPARVDREDLAQEARVGLLYAIRGWNPARGPFRALAARCVHNQVMKALDAACAEKHAPLSGAQPLDLPSPASPGARQDLGWSREEVLRSRLGDPEASVLWREQLAMVTRTLPALSEKERAVITGMLNGCSHDQLAEELGGSRKAVTLALRRARNKLAEREMAAAADRGIADRGPALDGRVHGMRSYTAT
jgi:RNA polymerase sigma factor (sigma-70 family)